MKILKEFIDFLGFAAKMLATAFVTPFKLIHSAVWKKKKEEPPIATTSISSSWCSTATSASYISGIALPNISGALSGYSSGTIVSGVFKQPGPENAIAVHIQKD